MARTFFFAFNLWRYLQSFPSMCTNNWTVNTGAKIVANNKLQKSKEIYCCNKLVEYRNSSFDSDWIYINKDVLLNSQVGYILFATRFDNNSKMHNLRKIKNGWCGKIKFYSSPAILIHILLIYRNEGVNINCICQHNFREICCTS